MGVDNYPGPREIAAIDALCDEVLQPLRNRYGKPVYIVSGFRSLALNSIIPGAAKNSQHMDGEAADLDTVNDNHILFEIIKNELGFDQLIWEHGDDETPDWVHVSYKADGNNRREILKAYRDEYGMHYAKVS